MTRHTFRKHEHLCGRIRIREVVTKGRTVHEAPFKLVGKLMPLPTAAPAQVAFAVPRRNVRLATGRNRVKRLMREAWRLDKENWYATLREKGRQCAWLIVYQGDGHLTLAEARSKISSAVGRWLHQHG